MAEAMAGQTCRLVEDYEDNLSFAIMLQQGKEGAEGSAPRHLSSADPDFEFQRPAASPASHAALLPSGRLRPRPSPPPVRDPEAPTLGSLLSSSSSSGASSRSDGGSRRVSSGRRSDQPSQADQAWLFFRSGRPAALAPSSPGRGSRRSTAGVAGLPQGVGLPGRGVGKQRQGLFGSIMSGCKTCHALEPSKQVQSSIVGTSLENNFQF